MNRAAFQALVWRLFGEGLARRVTLPADQYAERFIHFNEPKRVGRFSFFGREYLREPLSCYSEDSGITDMVLCFGTRTGKTTVLYAGTAYRVAQAARRVLYVKPGAKGTAGAEADARTRFIPMLRASPELSRLIPSGAMRHNFKTAQQMLLNGSIVDWTGSNSVANLASNSMEDVNQDEIDKFNSARRRDSEGNEVEADAVDLADERTREYSNPRRVKASTPTIPSGRIWVELMGTDLRRRFVPCPLCGRSHPSSRLLVLAWSQEFTVLPQKGADGNPLPIAFVQWDKEAKKPDGTWDLDRVEKSAGYVCPHCSGRFHDHEKNWMDANGVWIPTQTCTNPRVRGYQLPSMYSGHDQTTAGRLAVEFIEDIKSLRGPRNFINSTLAEPYTAQDTRADRVEIISPPDAAAPDSATPVLTVDYQLLAPHFWYVVRLWSPGVSRLIDFGHLDTWEEVRSKQLEHKIADNRVGVDSGKFAEEVYEVCLKYGRLIRPPGRVPIWVGWLPMKGSQTRESWKETESGLQMPFFLSSAALPHRRFRLPLLLFSADMVKDMLWRMRRKRTAHRYEFSAKAATDEYFRHLDGEVRKPRIVQGVLIEKWSARSRDWPNHGLDCESMSVTLALFNKFLPWATVEQTRRPEPNQTHDEPNTAASAVAH